MCTRIGFQVQPNYVQRDQLLQKRVPCRDKGLENARRKIRIEPLKDTNLDVTQRFLIDK